MTTMFIQLRRVVYLLVLLQCCVCVANASGAGEVPSSSAEDVFSSAERDLTVAVAKAYELLLERKSCLSVLEEEIKLCDDNSLRAKETATNMVSRVEEIKKETKGGELDVDGAVIEGLKKQVQDAKKTIEKYEHAVADTTFFVSNKRHAKKPCWVSRGNDNDVVRQVKRKHFYYLTLREEEEYTTPERKALTANSTKTSEELSTLNNKLLDTLRRGRVAKKNAETQMKKSGEALKKSLKELGEIERKLKAKKEKENLERVGDEVETIAAVRKEKPDGVTAESEPNITNAQKEPKITEIKDNQKGAEEEVTPPIEKEEKRAEEGTGMKGEEEEKRESVKAEKGDEEKRKELEILAAQERAKRAKNEQYRLAAEEWEKRVKEDLERLVTKERAKRAKEKEETTTAGSVAESNKDNDNMIGKQTTETPKKPNERLTPVSDAPRSRSLSPNHPKKKDGTDSPALVHSPLLLLLLCVLGCTLVC